MIELSEIMTEVGKWMGGGAGGILVGYIAQKKAAKSAEMSELNEVKNGFKEFAEFTRKELEISRKDRKDCQEENASMLDTINGLKIDVSDLTIIIHQKIGTPIEIRKGLNRGGKGN